MIEMQRLLILGASVLQVPAIKKARELGLYVGVVDLNPVSPGRELADRFFEVSTIDIDGVIEVAKNFKPDGVITLATDMPMRAVAAVSECLGLPGISPSVALNATDKVAMIECFVRNSVPCPWYFVVSSLEQFKSLLKKISLPFILKPNDSSGSRGVILIREIEKAIDGFIYSKSFSKTGTVLVEEYMKGPEVSVEVLTVKGFSTVVAITDKITSGEPHFVEMGHSQPSQLSPLTVEKIKEISIRAVAAIGIDNGPSHVEIIVTESGPKLVELGARLGGDCITTHLVPLSTGIDMVKASIQLALGQIPDIETKINKGAAIRYFDSHDGVLKDILGLEKIKKVIGVKHFQIVKQKGENIHAIRGSGDRIGYVICQSETPSEALGLCEQVLKSVDILIE